MMRTCGRNNPRDGSSPLGHVARPTLLTFLLTLCFLVCSPVRIEVQSCSACSISSNFNDTPISAGDTVWFSNALNVKGLESQPVTNLFTGSTIHLTAGGTPVRTRSNHTKEGAHRGRRYPARWAS